MKAAEAVVEVNIITNNNILYNLYDKILILIFILIGRGRFDRDGGSGGGYRGSREGG